MKTVDIEKSIWRGNYIHDKNVRQPGGNTIYHILDYVHDRLWKPMEFYNISSSVANSFNKSL